MQILVKPLMGFKRGEKEGKILQKAQRKKKSRLKKILKMDIQQASKMWV